jgi:hypothetical protein
MKSVPPPAATPPSVPLSPAHIVQHLESSFPAIGDRAKKAAKLYTAGEVHPLPTTRLLRDDRWKVLGYTTSISGKYCTCDDEASAPQHNGGPLCAHRIAAMLRERLGAPSINQNDPNSALPVERLRAIFAQATTLAVPQVRLRVRVGCTWDRRTEQGNICNGYLLAGEDRIWVKLYDPGEYTQVNSVPVSFSFTLADLEKAMDAEGWQFGTKNRAAGGDPGGTWISEVWYILPQLERDRRFDPDIRTRIGAVAA